MSKKPYKTRAKEYDPKVKIQGTFGDVIKVAMSNPDAPKPKPVKLPKKNK